MRRWGIVALVGLAGCPDLTEASSSGAGEDGEGSTSGPSTTTMAPGGTTMPAATTDADGSGDGATTTGAPGPECGDGNVDPGEACDDGNDIDDDACTNACALPACDDGIRNGDEEGVDCGGPTCPSCGCTPACEPFEVCDGRTCALAGSCRDLVDANVASGVYPIDPDGEGGAAPYDVVCDFDAFDGGWTLIATVSDDGIGSWTWNTRDRFTTNTTTIGSVDAPNGDFKSAALHDVPFQELYFLHMPSAITAVYDVTLDDSTHASFAAFMMTFAEPETWTTNSGFAPSAGTLTVADDLCEDRLYINAADTDGSNTAHAAGPTWRARWNSPSCADEFDDPGISGTWGGRASMENTEMASYGYGLPRLANTGADDQSENYLQMWVR